MAFFCAGASSEVKKRMKQQHHHHHHHHHHHQHQQQQHQQQQHGPKPVSGSKCGNATLVSSNGRVVNPFQDSKQSLGPVRVPHSDSDLNSRKMIVLTEYHPEDNRGLAVRRGESVQVISQEPNGFYVRNERNKEGFVPNSNLVAPYSMMRSRRGLGSHPGAIRPVASGSSIEIKDHQYNSIPMYSSTSAGRLRNYAPMGGAEESYPPLPPRRGYSPQDMTTGSSLSQGQVGGMASYDQKYSPSTSSGVASLTGTTSPVGHSDGSNHSSFCSIEGERAKSGNVGMQVPEEGDSVHNRQSYGNESEEVTSPRDGRDESDLMIHQKTSKPLPLKPSHGDGKDNLQEESYSCIPDNAPPPLPPRTFYYNHAHPHMHSASQGDTYPDDYRFNESDPYSMPADALPHTPQQPNVHHYPYLSQPQVRNPGDFRFREVRHAQANGEYSEVFQGYQRPHRHNGYRIPDEESNHSEGGSSRSRSSRKSGSRISSLRTQTTEPYCDSREYLSLESDITPNGCGIEWDHALPSSGYSFNQNRSTKIKKFRKNLWGVYIVAERFDACDENEVSVKAGDHVSVWNQDDPEWYWIVKHDTSEEGFVPSYHLKEIVNSESHRQQVAEPVSQQNYHEQLGVRAKPPPLPPKPQQDIPPPPQHHHQHRNHPHLVSGFDGHSRFQQRATPQDACRPPLTPQNPPTGGGFRKRLGSEGNVRSRNQLETERAERSISPPNDPPPPYTEIDPTLHRASPIPSSAARHFSLSQQEPPSTLNPTSNMQRTRSHGQVPYRRVNLSRLAAPSGGGRSGEGVTNSPDMFSLKSPTILNGGTLV